MNNNPKVLVVDDDKRWQEIYKEALEQDFEITVIGDKQTALAAIDRMFFHTAIVDLKLSEDDNNRDGLDVLRRIWVLDEGTQAIVGSGYVDISMFDEFHKMGIFSLTEIPAEARRQMDSINFFNGIITKNDPLKKILGTVEKAAEEAWRKSVKKQWSQSPFKIIKDFPAKDIQRLLRAGKIEELRPFLSSLVNPLYPWLLSKKGVTTEIIDENKSTIAFETICWSRSIGKCVAVRFGRHEDFKKSLEITPVASLLPNAVVNELSGNQESTWPHIISKPLEGMVYEIKNLDFNEYFDGPIRKRGS